MSENTKEHAVPMGLYANVWLALVLLTIVTVAASYLNLRNVAVLAAILIATVKASLVALYFMHLRFERRLYSIIFLSALGFLAICFILAFFDYSFR